MSKNQTLFSSVLNVLKRNKKCMNIYITQKDFLLTPLQSEKSMYIFSYLCRSE